MRKNVHHICERCLVYRVAKLKVSFLELYIPLPIPTFSWVDRTFWSKLGTKLHFSTLHKWMDTLKWARVSSTTPLFPFELVYGFNPLTLPPLICYLCQMWLLGLMGIDFSKPNL
ncbi:hypothetical protein CR513_19071, partial [Mucuna pruriens]